MPVDPVHAELEKIRERIKTAQQTYRVTRDPELERRIKRLIDRLNELDMQVFQSLSPWGREALDRAKRRDTNT